LQSKKILHIIDSLTIGGAESVFVDLIARFKVEIGNNILILRREKNDENNFNKLNNISSIFILNRKNKYSLNKMYVAHRYCNEYSIVHIHLRHVFYYFYLVRLIFFGKYKLILHDHEGSYGFESKLGFFKQKCKPDFYIAVAQKQLLWAINQWDMISTSSLLLVNLPKEEIKLNKFKMPNIESVKTVCVGNLKKGKNQLFGMKLAKIMDIELDFVGNVQDIEYYKLLTTTKSEKIQILEGYVVDSELLGIYDFAFCFSESESGPLVLLEYIFAGLPFISFRTGEVADKIYKYFPEFFCDNFNMEEWILRYKSILNMDWIKFDFESKRKLLIDDEFSSSSYLRNLKTVYEFLGVEV
jgi:hypothetical protein